MHIGTTRHLHERLSFSVRSLPPPLRCRPRSRNVQPVQAQVSTTFSDPELPSSTSLGVSLFVSLVFFARSLCLFSTSSSLFCKKEGGSMTSGQIKSIALSFASLQVSLVSFAHSCCLFSTLSSYIAKKRRGSIREGQIRRGSDSPRRPVRTSNLETSLLRLFKSLLHSPFFCFQHFQPLLQKKGG